MTRLLIVQYAGDYREADRLRRASGEEIYYGHGYVLDQLAALKAQHDAVGFLCALAPDYWDTLDNGVTVIGAAAGAMLGNMLANKFSKAPANSPAAQQVRNNYHQSAQFRGQSSQQLNTRTVPAQNANRAANPNYRQAQQAQPNHRKPQRRSFGRRR